MVMSERRLSALERLNAARQNIAARLGVELPEAKKSKDPDMRWVFQLEAFADTLEVIDGKLASTNG
jgi:hypothetical protein